jgi:hypothetical protein
VFIAHAYNNDELNDEEEHMMEQTQIICMAKEIIALDIKRDELLERFMQAAGQNAHALLRAVQNDLYKRSS